MRTFDDRWAGIVFVVGVFLLPGSPSVERQEDGIVVAGASLPTRTLFDDLPAVLGQELMQGTRGYPAQAHRIESGTGSVFGLRLFFDQPDSIDEEIYEKLTIWIPAELGRRGRAKLGSGSAFALHSYGHSIWLVTGCHGYVTGSVRYKRLDTETYRVKVSGTVDGYDRPIVGEVDRCHVEIQREFVATVTTVEQLTPWLGKPASSLKETYRNYRIERP